MAPSYGAKFLLGLTQIVPWNLDAEFLTPVFQVAFDVQFYNGHRVPLNACKHNGINLLKVSCQNA